MIIKRTIEIDYGHTLPNHFSFCNQIHGHRGVIIAAIQGKVNNKKGDSSQGMVKDFKIVKEVMIEKIHKVLDHGFAVWEQDDRPVEIPVKIEKPRRYDAILITTREFIEARNDKVLITFEPPTAEYLAKWAFNQIYEDLTDNDVQLVSVEWKETPNSTAIYSFTDFDKDQKQ